MSLKRIKVILSALLLLTLVIPIGIQAENLQTNTKFVSSKVKISTNSYMTIHDVHMLGFNNENILSFSVYVTNGEKTDLNFIDYWVKLRTKSGGTHSVQLVTADKEKSRIPSNTTETFTFYAKAGKSTKIDDFIFELIKWDFNKPNFESLLGKVTIPEGYSDETSTNNIRIASNDIRTKVSSFNLNVFEEVNEASLEITLENNGKSGVTLPEYKYYIKTAEDLLYPLASSETAPLVIQPRMTKKLELSTQFPLGIDASQLSVVIALSEKTIEVPVAILTIPKVFNDDKSVNLNENLTIELSNQQTMTKVSKVTNTNGLIYMSYVLENVGSKNVALTNLIFDIRTTSGASYPVGINQSSMNELAVNTKRGLQLTAAIPSGEQLGDLYLVLNRMEGDKALTPLASYRLSTIEGDDSKGKSYTNRNGTYLVKMESIQRLPSGEQDTIAATISVSNTSTKTIPLLNFAGTVVLDGVKVDKDSVKVIVLDKTLNMRPGAALKYVVYTKIPYTEEFDKMKVTLQEMEGEKSVKTIAIYERSSNLIHLPIVYNKLITSTIGKKMGIKLNNVRTFSATNTNIFYLQVEVENLEKRPSKPTTLSGYLKTKDNLYFPVVAVEEYTQEIMPNGKILISFWTKLPIRYNMTDFSLVLGEEHGTEGDKAVINAYSFKLPTENVEIDETIQSIRQIDLLPSTLNLKNFAAIIDVRLNEEEEYVEVKRKIRFNYELLQEVYYENLPAGTILTLEIKSGSNVFSKSFDISKDMKATQDYIEFDYEKQAGLMNPTLSSTYELTIYEEFMGHKKKLVSLNKAYWTSNIVD